MLDHPWLGRSGEPRSSARRIAFARILVRKPSIIILDEASSYLDFSTEKIITAALYETMKNTTCIIIAHRLSTILKSDRILVLENGKIIENGNHRDLMALGGKYHQLITDQQMSQLLT